MYIVRLQEIISFIYLFFDDDLLLDVYGEVVLGRLVVADGAVLGARVPVVSATRSLTT